MAFNLVRTYTTIKLAEEAADQLDFKKAFSILLRFAPEVGAEQFLDYEDIAFTIMENGFVKTKNLNRTKENIEENIGRGNGQKSELKIVHEDKIWKFINSFDKYASTVQAFREFMLLEISAVEFYTFCSDYNVNTGKFKDLLQSVVGGPDLSK